MAEVNKRLSRLFSAGPASREYRRFPVADWKSRVVCCRYGTRTDPWKSQANTCATRRAL